MSWQCGVDYDRAFQLGTNLLLNGDVAVCTSNEHFISNISNDSSNSRRILSLQIYFYSLFRKLSMISACPSSYGYTLEVRRAREKCLSGTRRSHVLL